MHLGKSAQLQTIYNYTSHNWASQGSYWLVFLNLQNNFLINSQLNQIFPIKKKPFKCIYIHTQTHTCTCTHTHRPLTRKIQVTALRSYCKLLSILRTLEKLYNWNGYISLFTQDDSSLCQLLNMIINSPKFVFQSISILTNYMVTSNILSSLCCMRACTLNKEV